MLEPDFMILFLFGALGMGKNFVVFSWPKNEEKKLTRLGTARVISVWAKVQLSFEILKKVTSLFCRYLKNYLSVLLVFWTLWKANDQSLLKVFEILSKSLFKGYLRPSKVRRYFCTKLMNWHCLFIFSSMFTQNYRKP